MLNSTFLFTVVCFVFLIIFFAGLPDLKNCPLPGQMHDATGSNRRHAAITLAVTFLYAFAALWNLGNRTSPETFVPMSGKSAVIDFNGESSPDQIVLFPGVGTGEYQIEYSDDAEGWYPLTTFTQDHVAVLKWQYISLGLERPIHYLRLYCNSGTPWLGEISLTDQGGNRIAFSSSIPELTDEAETVPTSSDYHNSSYFDEIYHARTAWEHLNRIWPYEISHPPLGKEILSVGILLFGMTPFGWRFSGTVIGILMLPLMYVFLMQLFGRSRIAMLGSLLMASGFMHYVQTRIATVDSYAVFFILLMYYFMYGWIKNGSNKDLALCGLFFGLGSACKWTCLYAGAGLAILWAARWISLFQKRGKEAFASFLENSIQCLLFFVLIPALIYYLSYLPYGLAQNLPLFSRDYTKLVLDNQSFMFRYHASVVAEHPYSSRWYQWMLDIRPILYYLEYLSQGKRISIACFANPLICWGGLLSLIVLGYHGLFRRNSTALFLLVGYASGLVPWMFITRLTFEYHYFASSAFLVPALCYVFVLLEQNRCRGVVRTTVFTAASLGLFLLFFPVLCGLPVDNELSSKLLKWLPTWPI